jgi:hypothetical protein
MWGFLLTNYSIGSIIQLYKGGIIMKKVILLCFALCLMLQGCNHEFRTVKYNEIKYQVLQS